MSDRIWHRPGSAAELRPDLVTLVEFEGAKHVQAWNLDAVKYTGAITAFIENLG